jgi:murein DD-endopeptidase MepM/ murein hydrolase activator NlpD
MKTACAWIAVGIVVFSFPLQSAAESAVLPNFAWPVDGKIIDDDDGKRSAASTEGVDILVPEGTEVRASLAGTVIYAGNGLKSFGNLILIKHEGDWVTVYAHNSELFVNRGDVVQTGDVIAKSGMTGFVSRPELHFEIRKKQSPWSPSEYLPLLKLQDLDVP